MQSLVTVSPIVCVHAGGPKNSEDAGTLPPLGWGVDDPLETCPSTTFYHVKFGHFQSNGRM